MTQYRVEVVDTWERTGLDQALEHVRADAAKRRASYLAGLQTVAEQMRERGENRYGLPIRVVEVSRVVASSNPTAETAMSETAACSSRSMPSTS
ncbi:hypothetical protein B1790_31590 [Mycobacterium sp. AT1]|nr:hypothetical protein B1790_31590 [Mycobacterium sp. AT1]